MNKMDKMPLGCLYEYTEDNIHQFTFTGKSERALDEFFEQLTDVLTKADPHTPVLRYLVNLSDANGQAPINELVKRFRRLEVALPQRPPGRTAIVYRGELLLTLMNTLIGTLAPQRDKTRFFKTHECDKARAWVLSND